MSCLVCGSADPVRTFAIVVDGTPLDIQPDLCGDHGDSYLLQIGQVLGRMLRGRQNEESGRPVSEEPPPKPSVSEASEARSDVDRPDITISGRPEEGDRLLHRWLAWFSAANDPRDEKFGEAPSLLEIVDATIKHLHARPAPAGPGELVRDGDLSANGRRSTFGPPSLLSRDDATYIVDVVPDPPQASDGTGRKKG